MTSHPISHLVWCVTPHYATGAAVHKCVKASTQPDLSTRSKMSSHSLQSTACLCFWIACMRLCVLRWHPTGKSVSVSSSIKPSATESPSAPLCGISRSPWRLCRSSWNACKLARADLHGGKDRGVRSGGLSLIIAPRTRDRTCMKVAPCPEGTGTHSWGDGSKPEVSAHAIHCTGRPQCEVLLSRTWPPIQIPG